MVKFVGKSWQQVLTRNIDSEEDTIYNSIIKNVTLINWVVSDERNLSDDCAAHQINKMISIYRHGGTSFYFALLVCWENILWSVQIK